MGATAVGVIGRFQPFHWGHFEYVFEAGRLASSLVIGVSNPTRQETRYSGVDARRSSSAANPLSYEDRHTMISACLDHLMPGVRCRITPCDLRSPDRLRASLGDCDVVAVTIYDEWGEEKKALVEAAGYRVEVLWRRDEKLVTGTEVRRRIRGGLRIDHLVPAPVARILRTIVL